MAKSLVLLVEQDAKTRRVLTVSLEQAGYRVAAASDGVEALAQLDKTPPDVVLAATELPRLDGYGLVRRMRDSDHHRRIPVLFVTEKPSIEDKIRGLELGVEDYLTKPVFVREMLTRVGVLIAKRVRDAIADGSAKEFGLAAGSLKDIAVVDLLDILERSSATAVLRLFDEHRRGELHFRAGTLIDATFERLRGEEAVFRAMVWPRGRFELEFCEVDRPAILDRSTRALIEAGLSHATQWQRLVDALPPLHATITVDRPELGARLGDIPDELHGILRLMDGTRTLYDVIDESPFDDLSTLVTVSKLWGQQLVHASDADWSPDSQLSAATLTAERAVLAPKRITNPWLGSEESDVEAAGEGPAIPAVPAPPSPMGDLAGRPADDEITLDREGDDESAPPEPEAPQAEESTPDAAPVLPQSVPPPPDPLAPGAWDRPSAPAAEAAAPRDFDAAAADEAVESLVATGSTAAEGARAGDDGRVVVSPSKRAPTADREPERPDESAEPSEIPDPPAAPPQRSEEPVEPAPSSDKTRPSATFPTPDDDEQESEPPMDRTESDSSPPPPSSDDGPGDGDTGKETAEQADAAADAPSSEPTAAADGEDESDSEGDSDGGNDEDRDGGDDEDRDREDDEDRDREDDEDRDREDDEDRDGGDDEDSDRGDDEDEDADPKDPDRLLSESGISEGFFASMPPSEEELEEAPFSEPEESERALSPEQVKRRNNMMRFVGVVVGIAIAAMLFIFLKEQGKDHSPSSSPPPRAHTTEATTAAGQGGATAATAEAQGGASADQETGDAGGEDAGAADDAGEADATEDAGDEAPAVDVEDPLKEAKLLANSGRLKDAIPMAQAAIKADPENAEAYMYLAEAYRGVGQNDKMQQAYNDCVRRATKGVARWCPYGKKE